MIEFLMIVAFVVLSIGLTLIFVGTAMAIIFTITVNKKLGVVSVAFPVLAIVVCLYHRKRAKYPLMLFGSGLVVLVLSTPVFLMLNDEYNKEIKNRPHEVASKGLNLGTRELYYSGFRC